jgi:hypothetical protein
MLEYGEEPPIAEGPVTRPVPVRLRSQTLFLNFAPRATLATPLPRHMAEAVVAVTVRTGRPVGPVTPVVIVLPVFVQFPVVGFCESRM